MSTFTPDPGTLFYADCRTDNSWQHAFFRCVAVDARFIVGALVHGYGASGQQITLARKDFVFLPVGPAVAEALGLTVEAAP